MGHFIRDLWRIEDRGTWISRPKNWDAAQAQLYDGEHLSIIAKCRHREIALIVKNEVEFERLRSVGGNFYIIDGRMFPGVHF